VKKHIKILALSLLALQSVSCAKLISGNTQTIAIQTSNGKNVEAVVQSSTATENIIIPNSIIVARSKKPLKIVVKADKCNQVSTRVSAPKHNPVALANAFFGVFGLTSTAVDLSSGAIWEYESNIMVNINSKENCK
jgi:hypothetical protein